VAFAPMRFNQIMQLPPMAQKPQMPQMQPDMLPPPQPQQNPMAQMANMKNLLSAPVEQKQNPLASRPQTNNGWYNNEQDMMASNAASTNPITWDKNPLANPPQDQDNLLAANKLIGSAMQPQDWMQRNMGFNFKGWL
jgi:hypothetical protein